GVIGVLFALLIGHMRSGLLREEPLLSAETVGNEAFRQSFFWFPWYGLVLAVLIATISFRLLHGRQPPDSSPDRRQLP
ncbi:MAG: hypothetical protein IH612_05665, partial [Desulfofustis sp.]|nr:hypothetical protein [Desulfofustis sp.]